MVMENLYRMIWVCIYRERDIGTQQAKNCIIGERIYTGEKEEKRRCGLGKRGREIESAVEGEITDKRETESWESGFVKRQGN